MNIFQRELKANRKALIIWSICMILLVISGMAKYTAYSSGGASSDVFNKMPFTMKALLGIGSFDVTQVGGFFAFLFSYLAITAAIHAGLLGSGIISKEEQDKTTEFLITKPVSRSTIITSKLFAALINVIIINLVTLVSSIGIVASYNKGKSLNGELYLFFISMFLVQLIFLTLGTVLAAYLRKPKGAGSIVTGVLLGAYVVAKITDLTDKVNFLNILSPFKYFDYADMLYDKSINLVIVGLTLLLVACMTYLTYHFYQKRDLNV